MPFYLTHWVYFKTAGENDEAFLRAFALHLGKIGTIPLNSNEYASFCHHRTDFTFVAHHFGLHSLYSVGYFGPLLFILDNYILVSKEYGSDFDPQCTGTV